MHISGCLFFVVIIILIYFCNFPEYFCICEFNAVWGIQVQNKKSSMTKKKSGFFKGLLDKTQVVF